MSKKFTSFFASRTGIIIVGAIIGIIAVLLQWAGNPPNMGVCAALPRTRRLRRRAGRGEIRRRLEGLAGQ